MSSSTAIDRDDAADSHGKEIQFSYDWGSVFAESSKADLDFS